VAALEAGGDDFITKPIRPRVLVSRLHAILRRMQRQEDGEDNNTLVFGDLRMDTEKIMVYIKEEQIQLAKKEFELLQLLASRPGKVFHRDEIYHKVWGNDVIVGNRTIDVHVRKLREKIGEDYIKTVKGIGYKFDF
jgi:two-component system alkaline phosphatase synthesis response regulator PhoP